MKRAIIDIGSNSVRLAVVADGIIVLRRKITSQLGEGFASDGMLKPQPVSRTLAALKKLAEIAEGEGVERSEIYAFATAAVRNSKNSDEFLGIANLLVSRPIDLLSGEREAEIALMGALSGRDGAVLDAGGASTELAVKSGGKIDFLHSFEVGAVVLCDKFGEDRESTEKFIRGIIGGVELPKIKELTAVGGTAVSCALISIYPSSYDRRLTHLRRICEKELEDIVAKLYSMTKEERISRYNLSESRAKIVYGGALILLEFVKKLGVDGLTVSEDDNLEGYNRYLEAKGE